MTVRFNSLSAHKVLAFDKKNNEKSVQQNFNSVVTTQNVLLAYFIFFSMANFVF